MTDKPRKKSPNKPKYKKEQFLKATEGCRGIKSVIYTRVGTDHKTYARYVAKHPEIEEARLAEEEKTMDWVESKIYKQIDSDNTTMTIFYAKTRMRHRGYNEETPISGSLEIRILKDDEV